MIIELKDIPDRVKHITFDISFENGSMNVTKSNASPMQDYTVRIVPQNLDEKSSENSSIIPETSQENRPKKEIPSEMTDLEF